MLLAHLRGLLRPDYSQGARSVLAERAILNAIAAEISADYERSMMLAQAAFAPLLKPMSAQELYSNLIGGFQNVHDKAMLDFTLRPEKALANAQALTSLFTSLQRSGFFDQLNEVSEKVLRETGWKLQ